MSENSKGQYVLVHIPCVIFWGAAWFIVFPHNQKLHFTPHNCAACWVSGRDQRFTISLFEIDWLLFAISIRFGWLCSPVIIFSLKHFVIDVPHQGPLPIKWMAVESLTHKIFNVRTDVWAYGITVWELFSLASTPYPGLELDENFIHRIQSGYRMRCPQYCPQKVWVP